MRGKQLDQVVLDADCGYLGGALSPGRYSLTLGPVQHCVDALVAPTKPVSVIVTGAGLARVEQFKLRVS
jgi:hypothetical protein